MIDGFYNVLFFLRLAQSVRVMMGLAIFLSYGLQFYVPMNIIWPLLKDRLQSEKAQLYGEYILRTVIVTFTCKYLSGIGHYCS